jgi:hypothetical protein
MKRIALSAFVVAALAMSASLPAFATHGGDAHPECADIIGGTVVYNTAQNTVTGSLETFAPSCRNVRYTIFISYTTNGVAQTDSATLGGNRTNFVTGFEITGVDADNDAVCFYTTARRGKTVFDTAPDSGCVAAAVDASPGGGGFD